jgi:hypothetical protein
MAGISPNKILSVLVVIASYFIEEKKTLKQSYFTLKVARLLFF